MSYEYGKLQNGSDIRGVALALDPAKKVNLDGVAASRLAEGFLYLLTQRTNKNPRQLRIVIGRDSRLSGPNLANAAATALAARGACVLNAGLASTPAMFMACVLPDFQCDGAIMLTASHLPADRNGMKFFTKDGGLNKGDITDIINFAESSSLLGQLGTGQGSQEPCPLMEAYAAHLRTLICNGLEGGAAPLQGLSITVDAGHGSGGFYAEKVLAPLGADVSSSQFLTPDGTFPAHAPNPEDPAAMASICQRVQESGSDLGLIFDTDVDRVSAVDEKGREINRNAIVAVASALVAKDHPGTTVVTDSVTSDHLTTFLEKELGLSHLRYQRGYRNVITKAQALCQAGQPCDLAIETSGHAAFRDNYFLDDGAYLATRIVIEAARLKAEKKGFSTLVASLGSPADYGEVRIPITSDTYPEDGQMVLDYLTSLVEAGNMKGCRLHKPNYEGVRVDFAIPEIQGWLLLRKSLHDPLLSMTMESDVAGGCTLIRQVMLPLLSGFGFLDLCPLQ